MANGFDDFAEGFASTFAPTFSKAYQSSVDRHDDLIKNNMTSWNSKYEKYLDAEKTNASSLKQAKALAAQFNQPESAIPDIAYQIQMLGADKVYDDFKEGFTFQPVKQESNDVDNVKAPVADDANAANIEAPTLDNTQTVKTDVVDSRPDNTSTDNQMADGALGDDSKTGKDTGDTGDTDEQTEETFFGRLRREAGEKYTDRVRNETMANLGVGEDLYNQVLAGYSTTIEPTGQFTLQGKPDVPSSFADAVLTRLYNDPEFAEATPEQQDEMIVVAKRSLDKPSTSTMSANELALSMLTESEEWKNADSTKRMTLLDDHMATFGKTDKVLSAEQEAFELFKQTPAYTTASAGDRAQLIADWKTDWNNGGKNFTPETTAYQRLINSDEYKNADNAGRLAMDQGFVKTWKEATTPDPKAPTSPKDRAYARMIESEDYINDTDEGKTARDAAFEATWKVLGQKETVQNPKQSAFDAFQNSDEYKSATPGVRAEMDMAFEKTWAESTRVDDGGDDTYTAAKLAAEERKYRLMLNSEDEAERQAAEKWLKNTLPVMRSVIGASESLKSDAPKLSVLYTDPDGQQRMGTGTANSDGGYTLAGGTKVERDNIVNVFTPEDAKARDAAITKAQSTIGEALEFQGDASSAVSAAYELDRLAAEYPDVLTAAGGVQAFGVSLKNEFEAIIRMIGDGGLEGQSAQDVRNRVFQRIDGRVAEGLSDTDAAAFKQFSAAVIRFTFKQGKALGQAGNGFSNADYNNINRSIVNSNDYKSFSNNIRSLSAQNIQAIDTRIGQASRSVEVQRLYEYNAGNYAEGSLIDSRAFFNENGISNQYEWANSKAGNVSEIVNSFTAEDAAEFELTEEQAAPLLGKKVIIYDDGMELF